MMRIKTFSGYPGDYKDTRNSLDDKVNEFLSKADKQPCKIIDIKFSSTSGDDMDFLTAMIVYEED